MNEKQDVRTKCAKWEMPLEEIERLLERLLTFRQRYRMYMRTPPHDKSEYGLEYMSGLLRIETDRTIADIGRKVGVSIQNMHHFISKAPWSGRKLVEAIQADVKADAI